MRTYFSFEGGGYVFELYAIEDVMLPIHLQLYAIEDVMLPIHGVFFFFFFFEEILLLLR